MSTSPPHHTGHFNRRTDYSKILGDLESLYDNGSVIHFLDDVEVVAVYNCDPRRIGNIVGISRGQQVAGGRLFALAGNGNRHLIRLPIHHMRFGTGAAVKAGDIANTSFDWGCLCCSSTYLYAVVHYQPQPYLQLQALSYSSRAAIGLLR